MDYIDLNCLPSNRGGSEPEYCGIFFDPQETYEATRSLYCIILEVLHHCDSDMFVLHFFSLKRFHAHPVNEALV